MYNQILEWADKNRGKEKFKWDVHYADLLTKQYHSASNIKIKEEMQAFVDNGFKMP